MLIDPSWIPVGSQLLVVSAVAPSTFYGRLQNGRRASATNGRSATLVVTGALLVTMFAIRNKCLTRNNKNLIRIPWESKTNKRMV